MPTLDTSGTAKTPFLRLVQVEVRKTWDTRAGIWLLGTIVGITALAMIIFFAVADAEDRTFDNFIGFASTPQGFLLPVLGILLVTTEWSQRTAMVTFALDPSRTRVIGSKVVAALIWGAGSFIAAVVIAGLFTVLGGADDKFEDVGLAVFALFFVLQLMTILQGLAYGLIFLNTPAAIVVFFVLPIASSIIFNVVSGLNDIAPWLDLGTAQEPLFDGEFNLSGEEYAQLLTTAGIWIVAPFIAGWFRVMRAELK
jgi:ABC-type transport system involved in multi-copper enzyme maturation permease subunit